MRRDFEVLSLVMEAPLHRKNWSYHRESIYKILRQTVQTVGTKTNRILVARSNVFKYTERNMAYFEIYVDSSHPKELTCYIYLPKSNQLLTVSYDERNPG